MAFPEDVSEFHTRKGGASGAARLFCGEAVCCGLRQKGTFKAASYSTGFVLTKRVYKSI